jgi:SAM-dependent methyltransferase
MREGLRVEEIRPSELLGDQATRLAADIERLLRRSGEFVDVACPACDGPNHDFALTKYELSFVTCSDCGTMYMTPRPSPDVLAEYYALSENYAYWNAVIFPASEDARREKLFRPRAERVVELHRRHGAGEGAILDVGAGFGTFGLEAQALGPWSRVIALEPTPDLARTCRERGLEVLEETFEETQVADGTIDTLTAFEVVEHLFSPREFFERAYRLLAPNGLLVVTCPSVDGFDIATLGAGSTAVDNEHLNYFRPPSLAALAERCGFGVLEVSTPGELDAELVRAEALAGRADLSGQRFLRRVLIDDWDRLGAPFQRFLADNLLSSHLWLVAQKPC